MRNGIILLAVSILSSGLTLGVYKTCLEKERPAGQEVIVREFVPKYQATYYNDSPYGSPLTDRPKDFKAAANLARPSVVHIQSNGGNEELFDFGSGASGSGVIISKDGYMLTNNHVVEGARQVEVTLNDRRKYKAKVIGTDPSTDLAVIKVEEEELDGRELPVLGFANSDQLQVGEWVLAVGNPFNLTSTVTAGIVSAKGRNIDILEGTYSIESFIQTDAAVNPGNSGGALIDAEGRLVGINTAIITRSGRYEGYSFAVPVNLARKVAKDLIEYGEVQRGFLGVTIRDVSNELAKEMSLNSLDGVYLDRVNAGSAAEEGGLKSGDIITHVNNVKVKSSPELQEQVGLFRPGQEVAIIYFRDGKSYETKVELKNASNGNSIEDKPRSERFRKEETVLQELGIDIRPLNSKERRRLDVDKGLIVTKIRSGSLMESTNMDRDFIIEMVNGEKVKTEEEFIQAIIQAEDEVKLDGFYENFSGDYSYLFNK